MRRSKVGALEIDLSFMTAKVGLTYPTTLQIVLSPQIFPHSVIGGHTLLRLW
jgi:hypothetical protein